MTDPRDSSVSLVRHYRLENLFSRQSDFFSSSGVKKKEAGENVWSGGKILDPNEGKEYNVRFTPIDGGKKMQVRGYIGPFYRTQIWLRAPDTDTADSKKD